MKKVLLFFFCLFLPIFVSASGGYIKEFNVENGKISIPFNEKNNLYTIMLNEEADKVESSYKLEIDSDQVEVIGNAYKENQENIMILKVKDKNGIEQQTYTFYLEKESTQSVSLDLSNSNRLELQNHEEIPHLKEIVISICVIIIFILFKLLILNFFKKSKNK